MDTEKQIEIIRQKRIFLLIFSIIVLPAVSHKLYVAFLGTSFLSMDSQVFLTIVSKISSAILIGWYSRKCGIDVFISTLFAVVTFFPLGTWVIFGYLLYVTNRLVANEGSQLVQQRKSNRGVIIVAIVLLPIFYFVAQGTNQPKAQWQAAEQKQYDSNAAVWHTYFSPDFTFSVQFPQAPKVQKMDSSTSSLDSISEKTIYFALEGDKEFFIVEEIFPEKIDANNADQVLQEYLSRAKNVSSTNVTVLSYGYTRHRDFRAIEFEAKLGVSREIHSRIIFTGNAIYVIGMSYPRSNFTLVKSNYISYVDSLMINDRAIDYHNNKKQFEFFPQP